jgi:hypothetical protein
MQGFPELPKFPMILRIHAILSVLKKIQINPQPILVRRGFPPRQAICTTERMAQGDFKS